MINYLSRFLQGIIVVFCIQIIFSFDCFGQYKEGYIVFVKGDTLNGLIDDQDWEVSPDHIFFKESADREAERIDAEQLEAFFIKSSNRRYVSRNIAIIEVYQNDTYNSRASLIPKRFDYIFLETILQGPQASLYKFINRKLDQHFYIETPVQFIELGNYSYYRDVEGKLFIETQGGYKNQLGAICSSAPNFNERIPSYTEESLKKYLTKYNDCFLEKTIVYNSNARRTTLDPMVGVGTDLLPGVRGGVTYGFGVRANLPHQNQKRFVRINMFFLPYRDDYGSKSVAKWISLGIGSYFGERKVQPYFGLSLIDVILEGNEGVAVPLVMNAGISYKKIIEFEVGHWCMPIPVFEEKKFFFPPSFSLRFHPQLFKK